MNTNKNYKKPSTTAKKIMTLFIMCGLAIGAFATWSLLFNTNVATADIETDNPVMIQQLNEFVFLPPVLNATTGETKVIGLVTLKNLNGEGLIDITQNMLIIDVEGDSCIDYENDIIGFEYRKDGSSPNWKDAAANVINISEPVDLFGTSTIASLMVEITYKPNACPQSVNMSFSMEPVEI